MRKLVLKIELCILFIAFLSSVCFSETNIIVTSAKNNVTVLSRGKSRPAKMGMAVAESDTIITEKDSIAIITTPNGDTVTIMPLSNFKIEKHVPGNAHSTRSFNLRSGKVYSQVVKFGVNSTFEIRTPAAIAGVRGTLFCVKTDGTATTVRTIKGQAYVEQAGGVSEVGEMRETSAGTQGMTPVQPISNEGLKEIFNDMRAIESTFPGQGMTFTKQAVDSVRKTAAERPGVKLGRPFTPATPGPQEPPSEEMTAEARQQAARGELSPSEEKEQNEAVTAPEKAVEEDKNKEETAGAEKSIIDDLKENGLLEDLNILDIQAVILNNVDVETSEAGNRGN